MLRALLLVVLLPSLGLAQGRADPEGTTGLDPKPLATAERHMIAAANPFAVNAGLAMLRAGGSAADAAIAALLVLNVVEPQSSGIGGGAFALVDDPEAGLVAWDARETAPEAATPELFFEDGARLGFWDGVASGRSVGVPGLVRLMETLHARHGVLPWADLFGPAIALARDGFPVSPRLAGLIAQQQERLATRQAAGMFLPGGVALVAGDLFRNAALAATLETLAADGAEAFYGGPIAEAMVAAVAADPRPGTLSLDDLAGYAVIARRPVCMSYRKTWRVCGMGPPSSGATTVGQILGLMNRFDLSGLSVGDARLWHLFAEASKLAYADRGQYLADSDFVPVPVAGLLDAGYLAGRAQTIYPDRARPGRAEPGDPPWREGRLHAPDRQVDRPGTTHLSVIDDQGLAISLTASIETAFGSGRLAGGFLLNNQLTDFSFRFVDEAGVPIANAPAAGKRPRSSMSPTIVFRDGAPVVLTGSPGGSRIPEYVAGSLIGMLDFGLDPAAAAALAHVSDRNRDTVVVEPEIGSAVIEGLTALGHQVESRPLVSGLHIIAAGADGLSGGADPRREGIASGD